ncbi:NAD-dependent epimerase/dehydratase family protein [Lactococcus cremoris]|uniref:NAD-dependent epimerase/dehydratase family protein n=1 Tax=Lactococcus lactis subsp. cremoris TaxID=1359 RepID=UPI0003AB5E4A|nr:NAD-dependent epimerase/dehydratase family protein [Lactococcus cremoris]AGV72869.1 NAD-dependent epimerase/dehydratase [Lactococcus cremoris subsp. cremoris KW2]
MKEILVMGGTGAMGMYLVPLLLQKEYKVWVTTRREYSSTDSNLVYLIGNAKDSEWLLKVIGGRKFDAVFDFMMYSNLEFEAAVSKLLCMTKQYFYFSSYRAYGDNSGELTEQNTDLKIDLVDINSNYKIDNYGLRKGHQEQLLWNSGKKNWTIIRPTMTYGKNRIQWFAGDNFDVMRAVRGVLTALPSSAYNSYTSFTYGKDVALMLEALIGNKKALGEDFHTSTEAITWGESIDIFYRVFGLQVLLVKDEEYLKSIDIDDGRIVDRFRNRNFSNHKILGVTGLSKNTFHTLEKGLSEVWRESDTSSYQISNIAAYHQAKFDALTHSLTDLKYIPQTTRIQFDSIRKNSLFKEKVKIGAFRLCVINDYWKVQQSIEGVKIFRTEKLSNGPVMDNRWLNFEIDNSANTKEGENYCLALIIESEIETEFTPFLHHWGVGVQLLGKQHLRIGLNQLEIYFKAVRDNFTDFSLTATDFTIQISFFIKEMQLKKV